MSGPEDRRGTDGGEHPLDVDAQFADIVSHFHDDEPTRPRVVDVSTEEPDPGPTGPTGPADPTGSPDAGADPPTDQQPDPSDRPSPEPVALPVTDEDLVAERRAHEARVAAEIDRAVDGPDGGRFVPEDPPPLPRPDLPGRLAWAAVLAGPLLLLLCALLWRSAPPWLLGSIVTAVVAGFGFLVWRLPRTGDRDDRDDGAIV